MYSNISGNYQVLKQVFLEERGQYDLMICSECDRMGYINDFGFLEELFEKYHVEKSDFVECGNCSFKLCVDCSYDKFYLTESKEQGYIFCKECAVTFSKTEKLPDYEFLPNNWLYEDLYPKSYSNIRFLNRIAPL